MSTFFVPKSLMFPIKPLKIDFNDTRHIYVTCVCFAKYSCLCNLCLFCADEIPCIPRMAISVLFKDGGVSASNPGFIEKLAGTLSNLDDQPKVKIFLNITYLLR
jgi:hypothetical protein